MLTFRRYEVFRPFGLVQKFLWRHPEKLYNAGQLVSCNL
jgi:hypothetical protein